MLAVPSVPTLCGQGISSLYMGYSKGIWGYPKALLSAYTRGKRLNRREDQGESQEAEAFRHLVGAPESFRLRRAQCRQTN